MQRRTVEVDGVALAVLDTGTGGSGPPVVCLPGWSQAASQFEAVMERLAPIRRVVAIDHRGQGASAHPASGYRIHRLAADVRGVLDVLGLDRVVLLGHSMGVAVVWAFLELHGTDRIDRLVLHDQRPTLLRDPAWTDEQARVAGGQQTAEQLWALCHRLRSDDGWNAVVEILRTMVSADLPPERFEKLVETNRPTTGTTRASLWYDQSTIDWRDLIPTVDLPALVVHGMASRIPVESQQWIADVMPRGELATIPADEGGSHFAFWENPDRFAAIVAEFLQRAG